MIHNKNILLSSAHFAEIIVIWLYNALDRYALFANALAYSLEIKKLQYCLNSHSVTHNIKLTLIFGKLFIYNQAFKCINYNMVISHPIKWFTYAKVLHIIIIVCKQVVSQILNCGPQFFLVTYTIIKYKPIQMFVILVI